MKKKYAVTLVVIVTLLTVTLSLSTSYGLWKILNNDDIATDLNGCFEILYPSKSAIEKIDFTPLNEERGKSVEPLSLSIKNTCSNAKTAEIRLNIDEENDINVKGLTLYVQGDYTLEPTKYNKLKNSRANMDGLSYSKTITSVEINPGATIRLNIKMWLDEKVISSISESAYLKASFEVTDKESIYLPTFKETIIENNGGIDAINNKQKPDYSTISENNSGLYLTEDDDGQSYYFYGNVTNNYVNFANKMWRIVRINGDESVRLILDETVEESEYNTPNNTSHHAGYLYFENDLLKGSTIKGNVDSWYQENIKKYDNYIAVSSYCNDTNSYVSNWHTYFQGTARLVTDKKPSLICETSTENFGGTYRGRIGLITADEVALAGGIYGLDNADYYLNNGTDFYTMTPRDYYYSTSMFVVKANGSLNQSLSNYKSGIRPVISLKSNIVVVGDGTKDNPYKIDEDANE